jgi:predicted amidohydrolase YtcJ
MTHLSKNQQNSEQEKVVAVEKLGMFTEDIALVAITAFDTNAKKQQRRTRLQGAAKVIASIGVSACQSRCFNQPVSTIVSMT